MFGCGGGSSSSSAPSHGPPGTFSEVYAALFPTGTTSQCNYCHDRPPNNISNGKLDMGHTPGDAYNALFGQVSSSAKCGGRQLVAPGDPSSSLFYLKLTASAPCGDRMPQGATPLTDAQLVMVRSWIAAGAQNN
jgi:hypothetical protein